MSGKPIAWLHEPTGNVFKDGECQALIKVWQKQFAASIPAEEIAADFVPLGRADASSQAEIERLTEALQMCARLLPRYRLAGRTTGDDEALAAVLETVTEALGSKE